MDQTPPTVDGILAMLADHPAVLVALAKALRKVKVAGPWEPAKAPGMEIGSGWWRIRSQGPGSNHWEHGAVVTVYPSGKLEKPDTSSYIWEGYGNQDDPPYDEDAYEEALAEYHRRRPHWRPWTWRPGGKLEVRYAGTFVGAMRLADDYLRDQGWSLVGGPPP